MLNKYIKILIYSTITSITFSFTFSKFMQYNMDKEVKQNEEIMFEYNYLKDALFICSGLYEFKRTPDTKKECEYILTDLYKVNYLIKTSYPYTNFYSKYIKAD